MKFRIEIYFIFVQRGGRNIMSEKTKSKSSEIFNSSGTYRKSIKSMKKGKFINLTSADGGFRKN